MINNLTDNDLGRYVYLYDNENLRIGGRLKSFNNERQQAVIVFDKLEKWYDYRNFHGAISSYQYIELPDWCKT